MKLVLTFMAVLASCMGVSLIIHQRMPVRPCWCWPGSLRVFAAAKTHPESKEYKSYGSYDTEVDWNNPQQSIPLEYRQAQGKRIFYQQCVWCHADTTPAGPSNRSNVSPDPPLMNDGTILNRESDESLRTIIAFGGSHVDKSAMMPPYGMTLASDEIDDLIAYIRVIAVPAYRTQVEARH
jgi:mono/diheme cytochrome c family protein